MNTLKESSIQFLIWQIYIVNIEGNYCQMADKFWQSLILQ